jgi:hypothetical protein
VDAGQVFAFVSRCFVRRKTGNWTSLYSVQVSEIAGKKKFFFSSQSLRGCGGPILRGFPRPAPMENGRQESEKKGESNRIMMERL